MLMHLASLKTLLLLLPASSTWAGNADTEPATGEPAAFILLVMGLVALLLGLRNLRELRQKRMAPPPLQRVMRNRDTSSSPGEQ